jgi:hypothetical protein
MKVQSSIYLKRKLNFNPIYQFGIFLTSRVIVSNNYDVANLTITIFNDGIQDTIVNVKAEVKEIITRVRADVKIMGRKDENDKNFERELFRTNVDVGKAMKGMQGNYLIRTFFESFGKSADFELKLPFKKVLN